ncbi:hypothetical protein Dsin_023587 [Dipteronia sinensis]|uniref:NB-ARC domain-containing protein n=1 Tax=Dipteronia sinensis TaxID=43782 RepID=A0AAE0E286_9ROSI|nr:hypothetical protein Dsin_023587 [Dipteronia sinensis]
MTNWDSYRDDLDTLKSELENLIKARNDVMRRIKIAEEEEQQQPMKPTTEVQLWRSSVQAVETEVDELINQASEEIEKLHPGGFCSRTCNMSSSYEFKDTVADKLQAVTNLINEGAFLAEDELRVVISLKDEGALKVADPETLPEDVADDQLTIIGGKIGLFDNKAWKHKNLEDKASDIFKILEDKKFALLMDDLRGRVDLTKVGVPLPSPENSSKIVFTTRSLQICSLMEADKVFKVTCLSENDAWRLFKALVGDETLQSHPEVLDLAKDVSRECRGLPLALVSIGRSMASKKTPQEWDDLYRVLRRSMTSYSGSDDQLKKDIHYNLKLSYDNLQNDMFKSCFLYCCLFPSYWEIKKRDLIDYWTGEGFLDDRLGEQLSQGYYIIDVLLSVCLLEKHGKDDNSVKMHYWIRDMSLWIASKIEMEKGNCFFCTATYSLTEEQVTEYLVKATRMSLLINDDVIENLLDAPKRPHLQTLFLIFDNNSEVIVNDFFRFIPSLKVLNLSSNYLLTKLPWGISNLISLQHLDLSYTRIQELPKELRVSKKLKCLNLENTHSLRTIPRQLISEFSMLHVLRLWECGFILQSNEDSVVCNDAQLLIEELLTLKNLSMLSITLDNSHALQRLLSSNRLQSCTQSLCLLDLSHPKSIKVSLTGLKHLNNLEICKCEYLEELEVDFVGEAQDVRESPCSFYFLGEVAIRECRKLRELTWLILAPNLKRLEISDCDEMEEIINVGKLSECPELMENVIPFSKLKIITLENLPKLRSIYWTDLPFPDLKELSITDCPMLPVPPHLLKITINHSVKPHAYSIKKFKTSNFVKV